MKPSSIREHLRPYVMLSRRKTTIAHMFASAIAPVDDYDEARVMEGLAMLGQSGAEELQCVYCDQPAETWDHLSALVIAGSFSGHGHQLGNLVPCCKPCNSRKGNKDYRKFLQNRASSRADAERRIERISAYSSHFLPRPLPQGEYARLWPAEMARLTELQLQILALMRHADDLAGELRARAARAEHSAGGAARLKR